MLIFRQALLARLFDEISKGYNMVRRDLPDIHARARGRTVPEGECVYIRQIPTDHVINIILHFRHSKICPNLMRKSRSLYIVMGIRCDCGTLFYHCHDVLAW